MLSRSSHNRDHLGFTLIEAIVTVAVLALLMLAISPSVKTWMDNTRIRSTAESLQSGIQTAKAEAIKRNQDISFWLVSASDPFVLGDDCTLSSTSASWVVSVTTPLARCGTAPSTTQAPQIVTSRAAGESNIAIGIAAVEADGSTTANQLTFTGFGRVKNANAIGQINITVTNDNTEARALRIAITPAGQVRLCDPAVSEATDPRKC